MAKYGFKIHPESFYDGSNIIFSDATTINYIQDIDIRYYWLTLDYNHKVEHEFRVSKSPNSNLLIVPLFTGNTIESMYFKDSSMTDYYTLDLFAVIEKIDVRGNKIIVHVTQEGAHAVKDSSRNKIIARLRVYEIFPTDQLSSKYGLMIKNSIDFTRISDYTKVGLIVYKNRHSVSRTLNLADHIPNKSTYLVYADWNHPSAVVEFDYSTHTLIVNGGEIDIDIIIVNSNINIQPPARYGMIIRSSITGQITYSSRYAAVPINNLVTFKYETNALPFARNYIALGRYGVHAIHKKKSMSNVYHGGLIKFNSSIKMGAGTFILEAFRGTASKNIIFTSNINLLVIDGSVFC